MAIDSKLKAAFEDQMWRLHNLYWQVSKDGKKFKFRPNEAQEQFLRDMTYLNIIPKARQRGITTITQLFILDACLFNSHHRGGIIAHNNEDATVFFRDKMKFAYDNLPDSLKTARCTVKDSETQLIFNNGSSLRVGTSLRGGTFQKLHVSEFGKLCAKFPARAEEVITGALNTVEPGQIVVIESTAEGAQGKFYDMTMQALALKQSARPLTMLDYKLHFYSWWDAKEYEIDPRDVDITDKDHEYFDQVEEIIERRIGMRKRAWYVKKRETQGEKMFQEYPSTVDEAFYKSLEGAYYTNQIAKMRKEGRICNVPYVEGVPVNTFWDVGRNDFNAIWFHQLVGPEHRFIRYYENSGENLTHYVSYMQKLGYVWGRHYLPHDAAHERLSLDNKSIETMLNDIGLDNTEIVPKIDRVQTGIDLTRMAMSQAWVDQTQCKQGIIRLENYRKAWNTQTQSWKDEPLHDDNSNGADAFRQWGQSLEEVGRKGKTKVKRRGGARVV
jgi:hypothetical protein